jgi:DNA-binding protein H-NS
LDINLNDLSLKELKDLQVQVARAIASFEERKKKEALSVLEETARSLGFNFAELTALSSAKPTRKRSASSAKYANPANAADTWTGRGRKPRWFSEAIAAGKTPDDMSL